jgi:hypothetical protein
MKVEKKTAEYTILKRSDGRYAVKSKNKFINGDDKVAILIAEGLRAAPTPKPEAPAAAEEAAEGEPAAE